MTTAAVTVGCINRTVWTMVAVATCRACGYDMKLQMIEGAHERAECPCARSSISVVGGLIQEHGEAYNARWETKGT